MEAIFLGWIISAGVLILLAIYLGNLSGNGWLGVLIDERGRYSLTQFQLVVWTIVVVSLIAGVMVGRLVGNVPDALGFAVPGELLGVLGISMGSTAIAVTAKGSKDAQYPSRIAASDPAGPKPTFSQIFLAETGTLADKSIDVTKYQNFWFTVVLVAGYVVLALNTLRQAGSPVSVTSLPSFSSTFLILLGISHAGYIAGKLPTPQGIPQVLTLEMKQARVRSAAPGALPAASSPVHPYTPRNP